MFLYSFSKEHDDTYEYYKSQRFIKKNDQNTQNNKFWWNWGFCFSLCSSCKYWKYCKKWRNVCNFIYFLFWKLPWLAFQACPNDTCRLQTMQESNHWLCIVLHIFWIYHWSYLRETLVWQRENCRMCELLISFSSL